MNTLLWLPTLLTEWVKSHILPYRPSTEAIRVVEERSRNEFRLAAYRAKRYIRGDK